MKKLLMMLVIAACAVQAQADLTYYMATSYDGLPFSNLSYYKAYTADAGHVKSITGESTATAEGLATYFREGAQSGTYDDRVAQFTSGSDPEGQYAHPYNLAAVSDIKGIPGTWLKAYYNETTWGGNQFIVFFYEDATTQEQGYRVASIAENWGGTTDTLNIYEGMASDPVSVASTWTSWETVPEPTSGMLMLLGLAGLALKRKRA